MPAGTFLPPGLTTSDVKITSGGTNNYVMTAVDGETIQGEANLTFDGSILEIDAASEFILTLNDGSNTNVVTFDSRVTGSGAYAPGRIVILPDAISLTTSSTTTMNDVFGSAFKPGILTFTASTHTHTWANGPATVYIAGPPVAGSNVAFTTGGLALWVDTGNSRFDGNIDLNGTGTLLNVGASGNDWTANLLGIVSDNSGAENRINVHNTITDNTASDAVIDVRTFTAGGGDAKIVTAVNAVISWGFGADNSESSRFVIGASSSLGGADALRLQASDGEMSLTLAHSTSYFDYVCASCGRAEIEMFACCGVVAWHDDVMALRELQLSDAGIQHMAKLGIYEIDGPDTDSPGATFINFQKAIKYTWAGMYQNRERMDAQNEAMDERLKRIEQALGV